MANANLESVIVTITDQAMSRIEDLKQHLIGKGLRVTRVLPTLGIIAGRTDNLHELERVDGVKHVEREYKSQLPYGYSKIQ